MADKWELAEGLVDSITFVIEFVVFTMFIYEESMQIVCREFLTMIANGEKAFLRQQVRVRFDVIMYDFKRDFENYGILALYACNAYSSYLYSCMMVKEWSLLYVGEDRINYSFSRTGLF